ncbi:MAG: hypothetical protein DME97_11410 [Verrucomicrobia bacterium]|nr:MAG: hypothetical protein DME97_11410 [Verrucomicrobiota bacterium]
MKTRKPAIRAIKVRHPHPPRTQGIALFFAGTPGGSGAATGGGGVATGGGVNGGGGGGGGVESDGGWFASGGLGGSFIGRNWRQRRGTILSGGPPTVK